MTRDFYDTLAQVLPVLLLALIWDSSYLDRLRGQTRVRRGIDPAGVRFWTKPRVRVYTLAVAVVVLASMAVIMLVLAGFIPDTEGLRISLSCGLIVVLGTLLTRIYYDVTTATSSPARPPAQGTPDSGGSELTQDTGKGGVPGGQG